MRKEMVARKHFGWKSDFTDIFNESLSYISLNRRYIYAVSFLFVVSVFFGLSFSENLSFLDEIIKQIIDQTSDLDYIELIWFIFSNNVTSSLFVLFLGFFFGIFPLFNAFYNGALLGYVYSKAAVFEGYLVIWRILPHGIFELPAVFISLGLGVHLGTSWFSSNPKFTMVERFRKSLKTFLSVIVPLLIIAAIVESTLIVFAG